MLTELQAKHVTPFARDEAATLEGIFLGQLVLANESTERKDTTVIIHAIGNGYLHEATTADASRDCWADVAWRPVRQKTIRTPSCEGSDHVTPANPVAAIRLSTVSMRLDRFPCMPFVRALAELSTYALGCCVPSPYFTEGQVARTYRTGPMTLA